MRFIIHDPCGDDSEIDLAAAMDWIRTGRLTSDSLVYSDRMQCWQVASENHYLQAAFREAETNAPGHDERVITATPKEFANLLLKLLVGAAIAVIPIAIIGGISLALIMLSDAGIASGLAEGLSAYVFVALLAIVIPYLSSLLVGRLGSRAAEHSYRRALRRTNHTAQPITTAIAAFVVRRRREQLFATILLAAAAVSYGRVMRANAAEARFAVILALLGVLLLVMRSYVLSWRVARGYYATNEYEARELIAFIIDQASDSDMAGGLGAAPITMEAERLRSPIITGQQVPA